MTDNELNMKVCEALGWEMVDADTQCPFWRVPSDQPWYFVWNNASICNPPCTDDAPDFLNDTAECLRLINWAKMMARYYDLKRAVVLTFLASKGVEVKDE